MRTRWMVGAVAFVFAMAGAAVADVDTDCPCPANCCGTSVHIQVSNQTDPSGETYSGVTLSVNGMSGERVASVSGSSAESISVTAIPRPPAPPNPCTVTVTPTPMGSTWANALDCTDFTITCA